MTERSAIFQQRQDAVERQGFDAVAQSVKFDSMGARGGEPLSRIVAGRTEMSAKVYRGASGWGGPILTIDNNGWVYEGMPVFPITGTPIMKISGDQIYRGSTSCGAPIATVRGEYVYKGTGFLSSPIALVDGEYVYRGATKLGGPIANVSGGGRMSAAAAAVYLLLM